MSGGHSIFSESYHYSTMGFKRGQKIFNSMNIGVKANIKNWIESNITTNDHTGDFKYDIDENLNITLEGWNLYLDKNATLQDNLTVDANLHIHKDHLKDFPPKNLKILRDIIVKNLSSSDINFIQNCVSTRKCIIKGAVRDEYM